MISDSNFVQCNSHRLDPDKTVFVGALHGMMNAEFLALVMNDLFGGVVYAGIDTDKHKYPIGEFVHIFFVVCVMFYHIIINIVKSRSICLVSFCSCRAICSTKRPILYI